MEEKRENEHLWNQFIRLGERIGDGDLDASESKWMNRDYKKLSKILIPELKEDAKKRRLEINTHINEQMVKLLSEKKCMCGGVLKQSRSGSKVCYCVDCKKRYVGTRAKK